MTDEKTWVLQAQQGSDEAFTQIVETYQKPVYNLCYRMLGESTAAEDAAQELPQGEPVRDRRPYQETGNGEDKCNGHPLPGQESPGPSIRRASRIKERY